MRRGMKKFSVIAAQSVTTKNPILRRTKLTTRASCQHLFSLRRSSLGLEVEEHDTPVGDLVRGRLRERVLLRDPAAEGLRVVLVPVDGLGDRDDRDIPHHR